MDNFLKILVPLCAIALFFGCEQPKSPDFNLEQRIQAPLTINNSYKFLGGSDALIDTTTEDFDSLFTVENDGLVKLSKEQDFEFGSFDDAIPAIDVTPTSINSQVGDLELGDLSSGSGDVGTADFQDITGLNPNNFDPGDPIPDSPTPPPSTNIELDPDQFESAVLSENGSLELILTNNLGFDVDQLNIILKADNTVLDATTVAPFDDNSDGNTQEVATINLSAGDDLNNLNIDVSAEWNNKTMQREPDNLIVNDVAGNNLVASQVTAVIPSQDFSSSGSSTIDDSDFQFTSPEHFVEISSGELSITNILNEIPLDIENMVISFPDIRTDENGDGNYNSSLEITKSIPRAQGGTPGQASDEVIDLSNVRIFAEGGEITYTIAGNTEDFGSDTRTISAADEFAADVEIENLEIARAEGIVSPRRIVINNDDPSNGIDIVDLFNDQEAETVELSDLEDLSDQLDGLEFINPEMSILYDTDLGIETTIIAAIYGTDPKGNEVYLHGRQGEETYVESGDIPTELRENGNTLGSDQLVKFNLEPSQDGSTVTRSTTFNTERTNVDEFLNVLPTNVRFIGVANLNDNSEEGFVKNPVVFDPSMSVALPIHFRSQASTFSDTTDADLEDLPGEGDSQKLSEAVLTVSYTNGLPLDLNLKLIMLDEAGNVVTDLPLSGEGDIRIGAASVDPDSRFVDSENQGKTSFSLNHEQLNVLNQTRELIIEVSFNTTNQEDVKVRADDSISLSLQLNVTVESEIN